MVGFRAALLCGGCLACVLPAISARAASAEQHGKTVKQCNNELKDNAAALEAAGESASAFFHACWWNTVAGQKTPIESAAKPSEPADKGAKAAATKPVASERSHHDEPAIHAAHHVTHARDAQRRFVRERRVPAVDEAIGADSVEARPVDTSAPAVSPVPIAPARRPLVDSIHVTVAGVPNVVLLPVLPGLTPIVRDVLNHPAVPGLTAAP